MALYKLSPSDNYLELFPEDTPDDESPFTSDATAAEIAIEMMGAVTQFQEAVQQCSRELTSVMQVLKNKFLLANVKPEVAQQLIAIEELAVYTEDIKPLIMRIVKAIADFVKQAWRWFFGFKAATMKYFTINHKIVEHVEKWAMKFEGSVASLGIEKVVDLPKLVNERITWKTPKNSSLTISNLETFFETLSNYIDQPEGNDDRMIDDFETSNTSVSEILGIKIISNKKDALAEARIVITPIDELYDIESTTLGDIGAFDVTSNNTWKLLRMDLGNIKGILSYGVTVEQMFNSIKKTYDDIENRLNSIGNETSFVDSAAAIARTKPLILAKEHIRKSQMLLDRFIQILNLEMVQRLKMFDLARKHHRMTFS